MYIYLLKKERNVFAFFCKRMERSRILFRSLQKNGAFFPFFSVLCKRMEGSFPFFRKERNVLLGLISRQKGTERKRTECPTLYYMYNINHKKYGQ